MINDHPVTVTFFTDYAAQTKREERCTLDALAARIDSVTAEAKDKLPWLKLALFGDRRSEKNSLRHDANVIAVNGVEGDYDAGKVSFEAATERLRAAGLESVIYTSPSYTPDFPKWRVLCPFSKELPPDQHARMLGRLAGVLADIGVEFARESWALSQSYYFGSVNGNQAHQVLPIAGVPIDLRDDLDATAIGRPGGSKPNGGAGGAGPASRPEDITDARIRGLTVKLLDHLRTARDGEKHHTLFRIARTLGGYQWAIGWSDDEAVAQLLAALPASVDDWDAARRTALDGLRVGKSQPLDLENRPNPNARPAPAGRAPSEPQAIEPDDGPSREPRPAEPEPFGIWDPWEDPPPPEWPNGTLSDQVESALAEISLRDGVSLGALGMTALAAASAAAPKDARFVPYGTDWAVPPIVWLMRIGETGTRKTLLDDFGFCVLRKRQAESWRPHHERMRAWHRLPPKQRGPKPEEPHSFIFSDYTPEALQLTLGNTTRGSAIVKDELAGFLDFDRYKSGGNASARGFFLSAYDDKEHPLHRISRDSDFIEHTGLTICGNIQPRRLAAFQEDMEVDGLLQRFIVLWNGAALVSRPDARVGTGLSGLYHAVDQLCDLKPQRYSTTSDGAQMIHDTETVAREYAALTDFGLGWPGFCSKLHGTHARLAMILHLIETPERPEVSTDTVQRAHRLVHRFVLPHAHDFYARLPGRGRSLTHDIAGWLLTRGPADPSPQEPERILASDVTHGVKGCRPLGSKAISEVLDPFVTGGWLTPETDYPNNRAWFFSPAIRTRFIARTQMERKRRADARALIARMQAHRQEAAS